MSPDKDWNKLNTIDRDLRRAIPNRMTNGTEVLITIERMCGFELFNSRPYHNYETWSDGWRIRGDDVDVTAEDLDDAVARFVKLIEAKPRQ